jgi:nucleoside-diphosphate-sugar epimerase
MPDNSSPTRVLITGAYGLIGNLVYARLADQPAIYDVYGLAKDTQPSPRAAQREVNAIPDARLRLADIADLDAVRQAVEGIDVVVHLAGDPDGKASWDSVLRNNIIGTHNVFEACRQAGVKRVVYGSTNQVVQGYGRDEAYQPLLAGRWDEIPPGTFHRIDYTQPTRPLTDYACSKVFGEALAHMYAFSHDLSCLCLRIGWVLADDRVPNLRAQTLWCSQRDIIQLIERCINAPVSLRFDVFFGQSENRYNLVDIQHAKDVLGYVPQDRAEDHNGPQILLAPE